MVDFEIGKTGRSAEQRRKWAAAAIAIRKVLGFRTIIAAPDYAVANARLGTERNIYSADGVTNNGVIRGPQKRFSM